MTDTFFNIMHRLNSLIAGACLLFGGSLLNAQDATVRIHDAGTGVTIRQKSTDSSPSILDDAFTADFGLERIPAFQM